MQDGHKSSIKKKKPAISAKHSKVRHNKLRDPCRLTINLSKLGDVDVQKKMMLQIKMSVNTE